MAKSNLLSYKSKRSPTQNAAIAFLVVIVSFVAFGVLPTQWFAGHYDYDPNLGAPLVSAHGYALYLPYQWILWGWRLGDVQVLRESVHIMLFLGTFSFILAILFGFLVAYLLGRYTVGMEGLHGTAHWAEKTDISNTGFVKDLAHDPIGVIVGSVMRDGKKNIIHPHHPKYDQRYEPVFEPFFVKDKDKLLKYKRNPKRRGMGLRRIPQRDGNGMPKFQVRKSVVKHIDLMRDGKNTHLFAFCPTRSGKGVGLVLPTLLTYPNSVMVNDPKGEAYALTAGFRKAVGQKIIKFEPSCTNGTGAHWNPLDEIRVFTPHDVSDAQMIMSMACDPKGEGLEDYFDKAGYEFLTGLALHMQYAESNKSLAGIAQFLGDPNWENDKQMYTHMQRATHDPEGKMGWKDTLGKPTKTHPMVANAAKTMLNKEDKDRSGVLSTAKSLLSLYLDPIVEKNTCSSDFLVRDLMTGDAPVSLYYVVGPADMERMVPLTRLFYALFIRRNAADMEFAEGRSAKNYSFPLLMIIDEATSLRKLPILQEALGYVAGYGIRMFMLVQDITQVEELYGDKQSFDSGAETRIVYAPNKIETAEKLARMSGKTTVIEESASNSRDVIGIKPGSVSISTQKTARDLLTADEFMVLHDQDMVVFIKGQPPIYGRKSFYYENKVMLGRAKMKPPARSDVLRVVGPNGSEVAKTAVDDEKDPRSVELTDKWAASREALKNRIHDKIDSIGGGLGAVPGVRDSAPLLTNAGVVIKQATAGAEGGGEKKKSVSRYADRAPTLSDEDREQIRGLIAGSRLMDKAIRLNAFN